MTICLQGGGEFSPGCRAMDALLLDGLSGPVVVTALAGEVGHDYRTATDHGATYFRALGATTVIAAPDVREEPVEALRALRSAQLVVLPGGSPSRLLTALKSTPVGELLRELVASGGTVMGASAGAMVLCSWTVLPDRRGPEGTLGVARGLGLVQDVLVLPHWSGGSSRADWLRAVKEGVPDPVQVVGLPEESGVLVQGGQLTAVGRTATRLVTDSEDLAPGRTWQAS